MDGLQGVGHYRKQADNGQKQGEYVFYQEQGSCPLDVVDDPAALVDHAGHGGEIRVQQHQTCQLTDRLGPAGHGYGAVRLLHGKQIIHAVAGHGYGVFFLLQGLNQCLLLLRRYPAEYGVFVGGLPQLLRGLQGGGVYVLFTVGNLRLLGDHAHRGGIVAGDHLDGDPLLGKVGEGLLGVGPQLAREQGQSQGLQLFRVQLAGGQGAVVPRQQQHPIALGCPSTDVPFILPVP